MNVSQIEISPPCMSRPPNKQNIKVVLKANKETLVECNILKTFYSKDDLMPKKRGSYPSDNQPPVREALVSNPVSSHTCNKKFKASISRVKQQPSTIFLNGNQLQKIILKARIELFKH